ncbi:MAG: hypothetical protein ACI81R_002369 [Bradymonadia bacterium]|jgi:hypothetical protein
MGNHIRTFTTLVIAVVGMVHIVRRVAEDWKHWTPELEPAPDTPAPEQGTGGPAAPSAARPTPANPPPRSNTRAPRRWPRPVPQMTLHLRERSQTRGIPLSLVRYAVRYGEVHRAPDGSTRYQSAVPGHEASATRVEVVQRGSALVTTYWVASNEVDTFATIGDILGTPTMRGQV